MIIQLRNISAGEEGEKFTFPIHINEVGISFALQPQGWLEAKRINGAYKLTVSAKGILQGVCARCNKPVEQACAASQTYIVKEEDLTLSDTEDTEDQLPMHLGALDAHELARQELLLQVPGVMYCPEGCSGLCPVCGTKKENGCNCETQTGDARWQVLKTLLTDEDKI